MLKNFIKKFIRRDNQKVFSSIYEKKSWGSGETVSGSGSTLIYTENIRKELPVLFSSLTIQTLLDAPCGDYNWMSKVQLGSINYTGADIVASLIEQNRIKYPAVNFIVADIVSGDLPAADLILCRDCFIHLSNRDIIKAIKNFKRCGIKYLLTTTFPVKKNMEILAGSYRAINMEKAPFNFPPPLKMIKDHIEGYPERYLGLWMLKDID